MVAGWAASSCQGLAAYEMNCGRTAKLTGR